MGLREYLKRIHSNIRILNSLWQENDVQNQVSYIPTAH